MKPFWKATVQGAACGVMIGLVLLIGARFWQPRMAEVQVAEAPIVDVLRATRFELVNEAGKNKAILRISRDGGAALVLLDAGGKNRAALRTLPDGAPQLTLVGADGRPRAMLGTPDGIPLLALYDAGGNVTATLP